ncbi:MAG TPA: hypothetical protein VLC91_07320 [Spongiibacteraceae bacterium]|nr:hypothetical protein [Spongiibacteraceae bacterium]
MTVLKSGMRLKSAVCTTELMVIRAPAGEDVDIRCGGIAMLSGTVEAATVGALDPVWAGGTLIGKRYVDAQERFELLCTKAGVGALAIGGDALQVKIAKALPTSD